MSFAAIADTYVHQENPADNYGAADALRSDRLPAIGSFLRFDVQSLPGAVVSATLRIYANSSSGIGYEFHEVTDDAWDEFTMTYENAPDIGRLVGVSGPFTGDSWTEVDVTDLITAEGILSLALTSQDVTAGSYSSREGSHPPELLIMTAD